MKLTEFMIIIVAALLFLVPTMKQEQNGMGIQAEEESPMKRDILAGEPRSFKITLKVTNPRQEGTADILWMKRAAEVAQREGIPYFNVIEQSAHKRFVRSANAQLSVIEGIIELDPDPMRAEFDAQEIESLVLTETP